MKIAIAEAEVGTRLDKLVVQAMPGLGRARVKRLFDDGRVRLVSAASGRSRRARKGDVAASGDSLEVALEQGAGAGALSDPETPLEVVLEMADVVVVDKPAGRPTAPLEPGERGTVVNALLSRYPEMARFGFSPREPGICHRLDTGTSGLVLAARTEEAWTTLTAAIKEGRLDKRYLLVCPAADLPESGTIDIPLTPHPKDRRRVYACVHPRDVARYAPRAASTTWRKLSERDGFALLEAHVAKAGRHQIRAHFAAIGHPLAGDVLYGGAPVEGLAAGRQALHAHAITWGGDASVAAFSARAPMPDDMVALVGEPPPLQAPA